jgi:hypothetical protein
MKKDSFGYQSAILRSHAALDKQSAVQQVD